MNKPIKVKKDIKSGIIIEKSWNSLRGTLRDGFHLGPTEKIVAVEPTEDGLKIQITR
jgi:hypothetical protein